MSDFGICFIVFGFIIMMFLLYVNLREICFFLVSFGMCLIFIVCRIIFSMFIVLLIGLLIRSGILILRREMFVKWSGRRSMSSGWKRWGVSGRVFFIKLININFGGRLSGLKGGKGFGSLWGEFEIGGRGEGGGVLGCYLRV